MLTRTTAFAAVAIAGLGALGAPSAASASADVAGPQTLHYSLTQTVQNDSSQTLTLTDARVDNNATIAYSQTTIAPHSTGLVVATNSWNGVQMWLTYRSDDGSTFTVDSDVPQSLPNSIRVQRSGDQQTLDMSDAEITTGDFATAKAGVSDCTPKACRDFYTPLLAGGQK